MEISNLLLNEEVGSAIDDKGIFKDRFNRFMKLQGQFEAHAFR